MLSLLVLLGYAYSEDSKLKDPRPEAPYRGLCLADLTEHDLNRSLKRLDSPDYITESSWPSKALRATGRGIRAGLAGIYQAIAKALNGESQGESQKEKKSPGPTLAGEERGSRRVSSGADHERDPSAYLRSGDIVVGYIDETKGNVSDATAIPADASLLKQPVALTVHRFYVEKFPGNVPHHVLFYLGETPPDGKQTDTGKEQKTESREEDNNNGVPLYSLVIEDNHKEVIGLRGRPMLQITSVPQQGLLFYFRVVELKYSKFQQLLKGALKVAAKGSEMAEIVSAKDIQGLNAKTAHDVFGKYEESVQKHPNFILNTTFTLGTSTQGRLYKLRQGLYALVQANPEIFSWEKIRYNTKTGLLISNDVIGYNYVIVGLEKENGATESSNAASQH